MPYLHPLAREDVDPIIDQLIEAGIKHRVLGVLNYTLSRLAGAAVQERAHQEAQRDALIELAGEAHDPEELEAIVSAYAARARADYDARAVVLGHLKAFVREYERRIMDRYEETKVVPTSPNDVPEYRRLEQ